MNGALSRLHVEELLGVLCPGAVLVGSWVVWLPLMSREMRAELLAFAGSGSASIFGLLLAYALGLFIEAWAARGFGVFAHEWPTRRRRWGCNRRSAPSFWLTCALHGRRLMPTSHADVEARLKVMDRIRAQYGDSVTGLLDVGTFLHVYRALLPGAGETEPQALGAADRAYRRRLFAQGVALASILVAGQAIASLWGTAYWNIPSATGVRAALAVVAAGAIGVNLILRNVSSVLHSTERLYTYACLNSSTMAKESHRV